MRSPGLGGGRRLARWALLPLALAGLVGMSGTARATDVPPDRGPICTLTAQCPLQIGSPAFAPSDVTTRCATKTNSYATVKKQSGGAPNAVVYLTVRACSSSQSDRMVSYSGSWATKKNKTNVYRVRGSAFVTPITPSTTAVSATASEEFGLAFDNTFDCKATPKITVTYSVASNTFRTSPSNKKWNRFYC